MAKEQDQTQQTEDDTPAATEVKEDTTAADKAVKTSEDFDKLVDANPEDVEETPPEDKDGKKSEPEPEELETPKADDKSPGKDKGEEGSQQSDDKGEVKPEVTGDETKVSDELAKRAIDLGFTEEEIAKFDVINTELEKFLDVIDTVVAEEDAVAQVDGTQTPDKKKTEEDAGIKFENEREIDPEILKGIRSLEQQNKELREKVGKLVTDVQQEQQDRQQEQQRQFVERFDGMVDKLGLDFADVFGKGSLNDLSKRSQAYRNRDAVRGRMYALGVGFQVAKETVPDEQKLFDLALNSLHGEKVKISEGLRSSKKNAKYAKGAHLGRSATKKTGKLTGDQKAIETSLKFDELIDTTEDD